MTDPRLATIDLGHPDEPTGVAVDAINKRLFVVSGHEGNGGFLDIFDVSTNPAARIGSPISFVNDLMRNDDVAFDGQVVFDSIHNRLIVSVCNVNDPNCGAGIGQGVAGPNTGFDVFDASPLPANPPAFIEEIPADQADSFAVNFNTNLLIAPSDTVDLTKPPPPIPLLDAVDLTNGLSCKLPDVNLVNTPGGDPDGVSVDPQTGIFVTGDSSDDLATALNLAGSTFVTPTPMASPACLLQEPGTPPNSTKVPEGFQPPGIAVNPNTHQAFATGNNVDGVALITLPNPAPAQMPGTLPEVQATLPSLPLGSMTKSFLQAFPFSTAFDVCHNLGFAIDNSQSFLIAVNLDIMQANSSAIGTALLPGTCAGTTTPLSCRNGPPGSGPNGSPVTYFPLPGVN